MGEQIEVLKFGAATFSTATIVEILVSSVGGSPIYLENAEYIFVSSTSIEDNPSGSGAESITITGLLNDFEEVTEIVVLDGTTPVTTKNKFLRLYRAYVNKTSLPNDYDKNCIGTISFSPQITGGTILQIDAGEGQTLTTQYTVPKGYVGDVISLFCDMSSGKGVPVKLKFKVRLPGDGQPTLTKSTFELFDNNITLQKISGGQNLQAGTDIWFSVENSSTTGGAFNFVSVKYELKLTRI